MKAALLLLCLTALAHSAQQKGNYNMRKSSSMAVKGSDTVGEEMFKVEKSGNDTKTVSFGMFKIIELDADNKTINSTEHMCNFRKMNVTCTQGSSMGYVQDGLDDDGNSTDVRSMRVTRRCDLSNCNPGKSGANATLILYTDIFDTDAYTCQPNCTTNANSTFQTPVSNGTVKWSVRMENWKFCNKGGSCGDKTGTQLKIVFKVMGKNKGDKDFKECKKKVKEAFDSEKMNSTCSKMWDWMDENRSNMTRDMTDKANWKDASKKWKEFKDNKDNEGKWWNNKNGTDGDNGKNNDKDGNNKDGGNDKGNGNKDGGKVSRKMSYEKTGNKTSKAGDKSGWGKCRNAKGKGPGGKPDDQENYNFGGDDSGAVFRMMGMAVMDNDTVADDDSKGFFGPGEHAENDKDGKSISGLIYIIVPRFNSSMEYDPTVDIEESGGAGITYDTSGSASLRPSVLPFIGLVSLILAYLLA